MLDVASMRQRNDALTEEYELVTWHTVSSAP